MGENETDTSVNASSDSTASEGYRTVTANEALDMVESQVVTPKRAILRGFE